MNTPDILERLDNLDERLADIADHLDQLDHLDHLQALGVIAQGLETLAKALAANRPGPAALPTSCSTMQFRPETPAPTSSTRGRNCQAGELYPSSPAADLSASRIWQAALLSIRDSTARAVYDTHFRDITARFVGDILVLSVDARSIDFVTNNCRRIINRALYDNGYTGKWSIRLTDAQPVPVQATLIEKGETR